jgi:hypothetical protein
LDLTVRIERDRGLRPNCGAGPPRLSKLTPRLNVSQLPCRGELPDRLRSLRVSEHHVSG